METTEKIVEAYVRYVKGWFTLPNIKCDGQLELDLLAVESVGNFLRRYHIESGVSISGSYSRLTSKPFSSEELKIRTKTAAQRRTLGYFVERKFGDPMVQRKLKELGFLFENHCDVGLGSGRSSASEESRSRIVGLQRYSLRNR